MVGWLVGWLGYVGVCWGMLADHSKLGCVTLVVWLDSSWIISRNEILRCCQPQKQTLRKGKRHLQREDLWS